ncbi:hypothetical protein HPP92_016741 [Vanilla planifolia]|uniref:Nucleoprotein TPR/MPL1 domain-containing protein n=1 Tax=Vanilla planifolia TaxID=51239 RepID=A0A835UTN4_VANPL|nr:hypothetical protein HPP92_016741 [Vanilla planifolia]
MVKDGFLVLVISSYGCGTYLVGDCHRYDSGWYAVVHHEVPSEHKNGFDCTQNMQSIVTVVWFSIQAISCKLCRISFFCTLHTLDLNVNVHPLYKAKGGGSMEAIHNSRGGNSTTETDILAEKSRNIVMEEKELLDKQNLWLDEELTTKANTLVELRRSQMDVEADLTGKIAELERQVKEYSTSLNRSKERVKELELRVKSLEEDLCLSKDVAAGNEEHFISELSTVNKLAELYKASSEEWSKKAGELEGVIKALETHLNQVADDYKEKLEKESSLRKDLEKEADNLRMQLEKCEAELESTRKANEFSLLPLSILPFNTNVEELRIGEVRSDLSQDSTRMLVPRVAAGVSGTALAASLLRDGWSLTKMYEKYQEAADALRHEKNGGQDMLKLYWNGFYKR